MPRRRRWPRGRHQRLRVLTALGRRYRRGLYRRMNAPPGCGGRGRARRRSAPCRGTGSAGAVRRARACRTCCGRRSTAGMFLRAFVEIGYFSLPVVALTAIFTGMVLALQSFTGFARFYAESAVAERRGAVGDARAGAGAGRADGRRPRRRRDGGRDRHHAGHRPDRRADHAVHQSDEIPGGAAAAGRDASRCRCWWWSPTSSACSAASSSHRQARLQRRTPISPAPFNYPDHAGRGRPAWPRRRCSAS